MSMTCRGCGNRSAYNVRTVYDGGEVAEACDRCQGVRCEGVPDVYLGQLGERYQNLCDDMGRPYEIKSKRHKKEVMDRLGVSEAGDRVHGAPYGTKSWIEGTRDYRRKQFEKDRPKIRETFRQWRDRAGR